MDPGELKVGVRAVRRPPHRNPWRGISLYDVPGGQDMLEQLKVISGILEKALNLVSTVLIQIVQAHATNACTIITTR